MHVPSNPIVQGGPGVVIGGGEVVGIGADVGAGVGAGEGAGAGTRAGAEAFDEDEDDADVPLCPPPLLPTVACEGATPPAGGAAGAAARSVDAPVTDATGSTSTTGPCGEPLASPPVRAPPAARASRPPPGP